MNKSVFSAQARNNAWANHRLLNDCANLTDEAFNAKTTGFFPSLMQTFNHILTVDWFYVSAHEGNSIGLAAFDPEYPFQFLKDLIPEQNKTDMRLVAFCDGLNSESEARPTHIQKQNHIQIERCDRVLLHLFQHQIHHRGQIHAMLAGTDLAPPPLDEFFFEDEREQKARAQEFKALGFSETDIWEPI